MTVSSSIQKIQRQAGPGPVHRNEFAFARQRDVGSFQFRSAERASIARNRSRLFAGTPATIMSRLQPMIEESKADELMVITAVYDHEARKKSYSLLADAFGLAKQAAA